MRSILVSLAAAAVLVLSGCGGEGDSDSEGDSGRDPAATAAATDSGGDGTPVSSETAESSSDNVGTGSSVTVGDESYTFEIECLVGNTAIIGGAGQSADGVAAFLSAAMPVNDDGGPANDPTRVDMQVYVGTNLRGGPAQYEYWVNDVSGSVDSYSDDGQHAEASVQFQYRTKDGAKEGLAFGDLVEGSFEVNCP